MFNARVLSDVIQPGHLVVDIDDPIKSISRIFAILARPEADVSCIYGLSVVGLPTRILGTAIPLIDCGFEVEVDVVVPPSSGWLHHSATTNVTLRFAHISRDRYGLGIPHGFTVVVNPKELPLRIEPRHVRCEQIVKQQQLQISFGSEKCSCICGSEYCAIEMYRCFFCQLLLCADCASAHFSTTKDENAK